MRLANLFTAAELQKWPCSAAGKSGIYVPARPEGFWGLCLGERFMLAWKVFTGKYDVIKWDDPS